MFTGHSARLSGISPPKAVAETHRPTRMVSEYNHALPISLRELVQYNHVFLLTIKINLGKQRILYPLRAWKVLPPRYATHEHFLHTNFQYLNSFGMMHLENSDSQYHFSFRLYDRTTRLLDHRLSKLLALLDRHSQFLI